MEITLPNSNELAASMARAVEDNRRRRASAINKMTNWQRNKFLTACKGDVRSASTGMMEDYADMPHWKRRSTPKQEAAHG